MISYQSLLLSTIVLNDTFFHINGLVNDVTAGAFNCHGFYQMSTILKVCH